MIALAFLVCGSFSIPAEIATSRIVAERFPDAPRCPKQNVSGEWLRMEVASRYDDVPWTHSCSYGVTS